MSEDRDRERLRKLLDLGRMLSGARDLDRLLEIVTHEISQVIECDRATLFLYDAGTKEVWSKFASDLEIEEIRLPLGRGAVGAAAEMRQVVNIEDVSCDPRFLPEIDQRTGYTTRNLLCVPLVNLRGDLVGVLQVLNKRAGAFDRDDEEMLGIFSGYVAVCIENALMAEESRKQERLALVGRMAATIAHDIRNPLSIIAGYAQIVADRYEGAREFVDVICAETERLSGMIGELLQYARGGEEQLTLRPYSLGAFLCELISLVAREFEMSGIRLQTDIQFEGTLPISRNKLLQACLNLTSNAREAIGQGGSFTIGARRVDSSVEITFTDTGPGIPREIRNRVFEPFVTFGKRGGTGLGLAITKRIVEAHGGTIGIGEGPGGRGTTVTVRLPVPPAAGSQAVRPAAAARVARASVDQEPTNRA
jgi:signal transduction histidine kinase